MDQDETEESRTPPPVSLTETGRVFVVVGLNHKFNSVETHAFDSLGSAKIWANNSSSNYFTDSWAIREVPVRQVVPDELNPMTPEACASLPTEYPPGATEYKAGPE